MAYATLSIDLKVMLASLQAGMDRAVKIAERDAARMERAFSAVRGIGQTIAAGFAGATFSSVVMGANDALLAIKDLAEGTGASIENVSALDNALRANNRSLAEAQPLLSKLAQGLKEADADSPVARALKLIGLSADELRRKDPVLALREIAVALQGYTDDQNRARVIRELFGKSTEEAIPFLNDFAEAEFRITENVRAAAEEADKFEKNLARMKLGLTELTRDLTGPVVGALNTFLERLRAVRGAGFWASISSEFETNFKGERLRVVVDDIETLQSALDRGGPNPAIAARIAELRQEAVQLTREITAANDQLKKFGADASVGQGRRPPKEGGGGLRSRTLPSFMEDQLKKSAKKLADLIPEATGPGPFASMEIPEALTAGLRALEQTDVGKIKELQDTLLELLTLRQLNGDSDALAEAIMNTTLAIDELKSKSFTPSVDPKSDFLRAEKGQYEETEAFYRKMIEDSERLRDISGELGFSFASAAEDAIVNWQGFKNLLTSIEQDILRIATRKLVTEPAAASLTDFFKGVLGGGGDGKEAGSGIVGFIKGLFSGWFAEGGEIPPGRWGIVGEQGPEMAFGGRTGKTIRPMGGGGIVQHFHIQGAASRDTQAQLFGAAARGLTAAMNRNG